MSPTDWLDPSDTRPASRARLRDWLALQLAFAWSPEKVIPLLRRGIGPGAALRRSPGRTPTEADLARAERSLVRSGAVAVPFGSASYPERLANLSEPPLLLWVRGDVAKLDRRAVAIVGSRAATIYGRQVAHDLAAELASHGLLIISGLAVGVDAAAHRGALEGGGDTIAIQACGPERVYPASHGRLAAEIALRGALLTELPPGSAPLRHHFPMRNRLISGLADALVVVEARERSGSLITAGHALDQGLDVFAVPGPIRAATSLGTNRMLRDGARPLLDASDVLDALGLGELDRCSPLRSAAPVVTGEGAHSIVASLRDEPANRDELQRRLPLTPEQLVLDLLELELEGHIREDRDGRFRIV